MSMTRTNTSASTHTTTISSNDVREVMRMITLDIQAICRAAAQAGRAFDLDAALVDVSMLVLNGIIRGVELQIHKDGEAVREYAFLLTEGQEESSGPPAGQPPLGYVPAGARVRLAVLPDTRVPKEEREAWFARLGWTDASPLRYPAGMTQAGFGGYRSGGLAVERTLKSNSRYDRAAS